MELIAQVRNHVRFFGVICTMDCMDDPGAGATSDRKLLISPKIEGKN